MPDRLTVHLIGGDKVDVDLEGRSSQREWDDLQTGSGRWGQDWIRARGQGTRTREAIVMVEVDSTAPESREVAEKAADEAERAEERKRLGIDEPPYTP
jgi:hypothetical protein